MQTTYPTPYTEAAKAFPRVQVPGVDRDQVDALKEQTDFHRRMRMGFVLAFMRSGKPVFQGIPGDVRKARRAVGKRQRAARKAAR